MPTDTGLFNTVFDVRWIRSRPRTTIAIGVVLVLFAALGMVRLGQMLAPSEQFTDSWIPGDKSRFVADVTIPDGTEIKSNARFVKVWALANEGSVVWHNRLLARMHPAGDDGGCQTPDRVPIGDTAPGEQVMISVEVTAPSRPGSYWVGWKMVNERGQNYFPSRRPVFFQINVVP